MIVTGHSSVSSLSAIVMLLSGHPTLPLSGSISAHVLDNTTVMSAAKDNRSWLFWRIAIDALCLAGHRMGGIKRREKIPISSQFFLPALESCRTASPPHLSRSDSLIYSYATSGRAPSQSQWRIILLWSPLNLSSVSVSLFVRDVQAAVWQRE